MTKVLITGVAGFVGSHLADALLAKGCAVLGIDNLLGGSEDNVPADVKFKRLDARDFPAMKKILKGVEVVYHCAAAPHEGLSVFSPNIITEHTFRSAVGTVSAAIAAGARRIINLSSMARYGHSETLPFTEDMTPRPLDPYGVSKYAAELMINSLSLAHGLEYVHAVPHNIIGPRQKYDDPYRNVVSIMINLMLQGRQPIIYGDGEQRRSFSFIKDVVDPLVKMGWQKNVVDEVINIGPDDEFVTINELARTVAEVTGFKTMRPLYVADRPSEVKLAYCSAAKSRELLGYHTSADLKTGISEMVSYIRSKGTRPFRYHLPLEIINSKTPKTWSEKMF